MKYIAKGFERTVHFVVTDGRQKTTECNATSKTCFISDLWQRISSGYCTRSGHRNFVRVLAVGPVETITIVKEVTTD